MISLIASCPQGRVGRGTRFNLPVTINRMMKTGQSFQRQGVFGQPDLDLLNENHTHGWTSDASTTLLHPHGEGKITVV